tara:strand:+ start:24 stop:653 length:630 start_codon:yes stop_codon:yes gene_type:complete
VRFYQPWSAPILHDVLPKTLLEELLKITDSILEDVNKKSYNDTLIGEIVNEWGIPTSILEFNLFKDYIDELTLKYLASFASHFPYEDGKVHRNLGRFAQHLQKSVLISAWFNDQKDNEYNPIHNHSGILSGVLYLKIPEYLPSRKRKDTDGTITFVANKQFENMTQNSFSIFPKVGDIFLFPSSLHHMVYPFRTDDGKGIRRSMSFNKG